MGWKSRHYADGKGNSPDWFAAVFILGAPVTLVLSLLLAKPVAWPVLWPVSGGMLLWWGVRIWCGQRTRTIWLVLLAAGLLGWQVAGLARLHFAPWTLAAEPLYRISGRVEGLPDSNRYRYRLRLRPECVIAADAPRGEGVNARCPPLPSAERLWPRYVEIQVPRRLLPVSPRPGQRWEFQARFQPALQSRNPGQFDAARWYRASHVVARFRVAPGPAPLLLDDRSDPLDQARFALREAILEKAAGHDAEQLRLAVPLALITGDRSLMQTGQWRVFNATGTTHLVAISGSHIVLVAGVVMALLMFPLRRWLWLTRRMPASALAALGGFLAAWLYGAIAGFGLPVQRALVMLAVFVLLQLAGRAQQLWLGLALAFFLVLLWDPMAVYALGFWLSFLAVFWILWMSGGAVYRAGWWRIWLRVQVGIFVGLAPVLLWQLQNLSLVSCVTNAFAIPLLGGILTPLSLLWALAWGLLGDSAHPLLSLAGVLSDFIFWLLSLFARLPHALLSVPPQTSLAALLGLAGVFWLGTAGLPGRWLAPLLLLPLLWAPVREETWLLDSGGPLQLGVRQPDRLWFVGTAFWPQLIPPWQQDLLRHWGVGLPVASVPLRETAHAWGTAGWVLSEWRLTREVWGESRVLDGRFVDLCQPPATLNGVQVLLRYRDRCVVRLQWRSEAWLLLPSLPQTTQRALLALLQPAHRVDHVLFSPQAQDRVLPALLTAWQHQGAELILSRPPTAELAALITRSGLPLRRLYVSGALHFPVTSPHHDPAGDSVPKSGQSVLE